MYLANFKSGDSCLEAIIDLRVRRTKSKQEPGGPPNCKRPGGLTSEGSAVIHKIRQFDRDDSGFSLSELLVVFAIVIILTSIAIPQLLAHRRLLRSAGVNREIQTKLRLARQLALSQSGATPTGPLSRVAFTFQYDNAVKAIRIIGPIPAGTAALADPSYPNNSGSRVVDASSLSQGGLPAEEVMYGIPTTTDLPAGASALPTGALGDGCTMTSLSGNVVNVTFQPDGSVVDSTNAPVNRALYFFNKKLPVETASAISVLGSSGRVKVWRYGSNANAYLE
jgi:Tfp pilus assembly protein FimT